MRISEALESFVRRYFPPFFNKKGTSPKTLYQPIAIQDRIFSLSIETVHNDSSIYLVKQNITILMLLSKAGVLSFQPSAFS